MSEFLKWFFVSEGSFKALMIICRGYFWLAVVISLLMSLSFGPPLTPDPTYVEPSGGEIFMAYINLWSPFVVISVLAIWLQIYLEKHNMLAGKDTSHDNGSGDE